MSSAMSRIGNSPISADDLQDNSWVSESMQGNSRAFNRLVLKWEKAIYNLALRMLQDREEASEATQEVFLAAFRGIRRFRQDSKFSTWLYRIALNHCISRIKQRPPGIHLSVDACEASARPIDELAVIGSQPGELLRAEQRQRVLGAMARLLPEQQAVIELKFFQEMTFEDIAEVLGVPISTIKSRFYAGLEMLRNRLGDRE